MGKLSKNQDGFSAVEAALIAVILGIVGLTGYFVWHAKQNTDKSLVSDNSSTPIVKKKTTAASKTQKYVDVSNTFSLDYPLSWMVEERSNQDVMTGGDVLATSKSPTFIPPGSPTTATGKAGVRADVFTGDINKVFKNETYGEAAGGKADELYNPQQLTINGYPALYHQEVINGDSIPADGWGAVTNYYAITHVGKTVILSFREKFIPGQNNTSQAFDISRYNNDFDAMAKSIKFLE